MLTFGWTTHNRRNRLRTVFSCCIEAKKNSSKTVVQKSSASNSSRIYKCKRQNKDRGVVLVPKKSCSTNLNERRDEAMHERILERVTFH